MAESEDVVERLNAVERGLVRVEQGLVVASADAAAARVLASGAHEDVAEVRGRLLAITPVLNALRETQVEDGRTLRGHSVVLERQAGQLENLANLLADQSGRLDNQGSLLEQQSSRLDNQGSLLEQQGGRLDEHTLQLGALERQMTDGFAEVNVGMRDIVGLLTQLIADEPQA